MQMTVFGADGQVLEARGPLRVVSLNRVTRSPVQLLITNEGLAPASLTLSLRPDPVLEIPSRELRPVPGAAPQAPAAGTPVAPAAPAAADTSSDATAPVDSSAPPAPQ